MVPITGEPFVWALAAIPIGGAFLLLNLLWGGTILYRKEWRNGRLWIAASLLWIGSVVIDFVHH